MSYKICIVQGIFEAFPVSSSLLYKSLGTVNCIDLPIAIASIIYFRNNLFKYSYYPIISFIPVLCIGGIATILCIDLKYSPLIYMLVTILLMINFYGSKKINFYSAIIIGIVQSFAIIPISRLGLCLITMSLLKIKIEDRIEYAFIIAIPTFLTKSLLELNNINIYYMLLIFIIFYCMLYIINNIKYAYYIYLSIIMRIMINLYF